MFRKLKPHQTEDSICGIDLKCLYSRGFRSIIVDLDNTITAWNRSQIEPKLHEWFRMAKSLGFKVCILSNGSYKRVSVVASKLGIEAAPKKAKPMSRAFKNAICLLEANPETTIVIGDQIFTDILGGNRVNLYTILVNPISKKEFIGTKFTRLMEKLIAGRRI
jgi:HAD superfamily phosphatase (TIGR01668 family)